MKPALEYTKLKELKNDLKKELKLFLTVYVNRYDGYANLGSDEHNYRWRQETASFSIQDNQYSCAIDEIGGFYGNTTQENWSYLFRGLQLSSQRKNQFYRCSVASNQESADNIINALIEVGFTPTGRVKSKHGNYYIYMLEWFKE